MIMGKLIILDYADGSVHIYDVQPGVDITDEYVDNLGFNLNTCSWMYDKEVSIHFHKRTLQ